MRREVACAFAAGRIVTFTSGACSSYERTKVCTQITLRRKSPRSHWSTRLHSWPMTNSALVGIYVVIAGAVTLTAAARMKVWGRGGAQPDSFRALVIDNAVIGILWPVLLLGWLPM